MYLITQFCSIVTIIETSISWNCNLLKILPTELHLKLHKSIYDLFRVQRLQSHCGHLFKLSVTYSRQTNTSVAATMSPIFFVIGLQMSLFAMQHIF